MVMPDPMSLALLAAICVAAFFGVKLFLKKDDDIERRREKAVDLVAALKEYGLHFTADVVKKYAVGDYSGIAHAIGDMVRLMEKGDDAVLQELDKAFKRVLAAKLATEEGRAFVQMATDEANAKAAEKA